MLLFAIIYLVVWPPKVLEERMMARDVNMVSRSEVMKTAAVRRV